MLFLEKIILNKKIKSTADVEEHLGLKTIAEIPLKDKKSKEVELISLDNENSYILKAFKKLKTNIQFLCVNNNRDKKVMLITSSVKNEGKSYVAANMAVSFAAIGKKVLLIDADMNTGRLNKIFNIPNNLGFSNYLSNLDTNGAEINEFLNKYINETAIKNINLITSGTIPPNSAELLTLPRLEELIKDAKVFYDIIIIDSTEVLNKTESLILARMVNSTILVADCKKTKIKDIENAKRDIQNIGGKIIGVVLNKVRLKKEKKTRKQKKEEFRIIRLKIKDEVKKVKEYIKDKIYYSKKKLLVENTLRDEKENQKNISFGDKAEENVILENVEKATSEKENLKENKKKNFAKEKINNSYINKIFVLLSKKTIKEEKELDNKDAKKDINENPVKNKSKEVKVSDEPVNKNLETEKIKDCEIEKNNSIKEKASKILEILKEKFSNRDKEIESENQEIDKKQKNSFSEIYKNIKDVTQEKLNKSKEWIKNRKKDNTAVAVDLTKTETVSKNNSENIKSEEDKKISKLENSNEPVKSDNKILIIIDSENICCRVFSKQCFIEKLIRGLDRVDGNLKAYYSLRTLRKIQTKLMDIYQITKKQAQRIDSLVYTALCDYDKYMCEVRMLQSNKAENYVLCMAEEYERNQNETERDFIVRSQRLRKIALEKAELDIEYKMDNLWKAKKINLIDKIVMKKIANFYEIDSKLQNDKEIQKSRKNKKFYTDIIEAAENKLKSFDNNEEKTNNPEGAKSPNDSNIRDNEEQEIMGLEQSELNKNIIQEKNKTEKEQIKIEKKIESEKIKQERKKEKEIEKQQRKEEKDSKRREKQKQREEIKKEKLKQKEELRKQKELEKEKQREEAKIEEELLVDNLYPKTKYNKNL